MTTRPQQPGTAKVAVAKPGPTPRPRKELKVGDIVTSGGKRGVVKFIGTPKGTTGNWVGIKLDKAEKSTQDGSFKGTKYFDCKPGEGFFTKQSLVQLEAASGAAKSGVPPRASTAPVGLTPGVSRERSKSPLPGDRSKSPLPTESKGMPSSPTKALLERKVSNPGVDSKTSTTSTSSSTTEETEPPTAVAESSDDNTTEEPLPDETTADEPESSSSQVPQSPIPQSSSSSTITSTPSTTIPTTTFTSTPTTPAPTGSSEEFQTPSRDDHATKITSSPASSSSSSTTTQESVPSTPITPGTDDGSLFSPMTPLTDFAEPTRPRPQSIQAKEKTAALSQALESRQSLKAAEQAKAEAEAKQTPAELSKIEQLKKELALKEIDYLKSKERNASLELQLKKIKEDTTAAVEKKMREEFEEEKSKLNGLIESLTLDKEVSEETSEDLTAELKKTQDELTSTRTQLQQQREEFFSGLPEDKQEVAKLHEQNRQLLALLRQLRDAVQGDKEKWAKEKADLEKKISALTLKANEADRLRPLLAKSKGEVEELKESLDEAQESVDMVEKLTEQNLNLGRKVDELKQQIEHFKNLQAASEEVEQGYAELEKQLRDDVHNKEFEYLEKVNELKKERMKTADLRNTLRQFRIKVRTLENDREQLQLREQKMELSTREEEQRQRRVKEHNAKLSQRMKEIREKTVRQHTAMLTVQQAMLRTRFIESYLPPNVQIDKASLSLLLLLERIKFKLNIFIQLLDQFYGADSATMNVELSAFAYKICGNLLSFLVIVEALSYHILECDTKEQYGEATQHHDVLNLVESHLDQFLTLISEDTLTEITSLDPIVEAEKVVRKYILDIFGSKSKSVPPATLLVPHESKLIHIYGKELLYNNLTCRVQLQTLGDLLALIPTKSSEEESSETSSGTTPGALPAIYQTIFNDLEELHAINAKLCQLLVSNAADHHQFLQDQRYPSIYQSGTMLALVNTAKTYAPKVEKRLVNLLIAIKGTILSPDVQQELRRLADTKQKGSLDIPKLTAQLDSRLQEELKQDGIVIDLKHLQQTLQQINQQLADAKMKITGQDSKASLLPVEKKEEIKPAAWQQHPLGVRQELMDAASVKPQLLESERAIEEKTRALVASKKEGLEAQAKLLVLDERLKQANDKALRAAELRAEVEKLTKAIKAHETALEVTNKDLDSALAKNKTLKAKLTRVTNERNSARKGAGPGATPSSPSHFLASLSTGGPGLGSAEARQQLDLQQKTINALRKHIVDLSFQKTKEALETALPPLPDLRPKGRHIDWLKKPSSSTPPTSATTTPPHDDDKEVPTSEAKEEKDTKKSDLDNDVRFFQKLQTDTMLLNQRAFYFRASPKLVDLTALSRLKESKHDQPAEEEKKDLRSFDKKEGHILSAELQFLQQRQEVEDFRKEAKELQQRLHQHLDHKRGPLTSLTVPLPTQSLAAFEPVRVGRLSVPSSSSSLPNTSKIFLNDNQFNRLQFSFLRSPLS